MERIDRLAGSGDPLVAEAVADVQAAAEILPEIVAKQRDLSQTLDTLGPDEIAGRIKVARRRAAGAVSDAERSTVDRELGSLQRQYELVHRIWDRRDELDEHLRTTVVDMEELTVQLTELAVLGRGSATSYADGTAAADARLAHLRAELAALRAAQAELSAL